MLFSITDDDAYRVDERNDREAPCPLSKTHQAMVLRRVGEASNRKEAMQTIVEFRQTTRGHRRTNSLEPPSAAAPLHHERDSPTKRLSFSNTCVPTRSSNVRENAGMSRSDEDIPRLSHFRIRQRKKPHHQPGIPVGRGGPPTSGRLPIVHFSPAWLKHRTIQATQSRPSGSHQRNKSDSALLIGKRSTLANVSHTTQRSPPLIRHMLGNESISRLFESYCDAHGISPAFLEFLRATKSHRETQGNEDERLLSWRDIFRRFYSPGEAPAIIVTALMLQRNESILAFDLAENIVLKFLEENHWTPFFQWAHETHRPLVASPPQSKGQGEEMPGMRDIIVVGRNHRVNADGAPSSTAWNRSSDDLMARSDRRSTPGFARRSLSSERVPTWTRVSSRVTGMAKGLLPHVRSMPSPPPPPRPSHSPSASLCARPPPRPAYPPPPFSVPAPPRPSHPPPSLVEGLPAHTNDDSAEDDDWEAQMVRMQAKSNGRVFVNAFGVSNELSVPELDAVDEDAMRFATVAKDTQEPPPAAHRTTPLARPKNMRAMRHMFHGSASPKSRQLSTATTDGMMKGTVSSPSLRAPSNSNGRKVPLPPLKRMAIRKSFVQKPLRRQPPRRGAAQPQGSPRTVDLAQLRALHTVNSIDMEQLRRCALAGPREPIDVSKWVSVSPSRGGGDGDSDAPNDDTPLLPTYKCSGLPRARKGTHHSDMPSSIVGDASDRAKDFDEDALEQLLSLSSSSNFDDGLLFGSTSVEWIDLGDGESSTAGSVVRPGSAQGHGAGDETVAEESAVDGGGGGGGGGYDGVGDDSVGDDVVGYDDGCDDYNDDDDDEEVYAPLPTTWLQGNACDDQEDADDVDLIAACAGKLISEFIDERPLDGQPMGSVSNPLAFAKRARRAVPMLHLNKRGGEEKKLSLPLIFGADGKEAPKPALSRSQDAEDVVGSLPTTHAAWMEYKQRAKESYQLMSRSESEVLEFKERARRKYHEEETEATKRAQASLEEGGQGDAPAMIHHDDGGDDEARKSALRRQLMNRSESEVRAFKERARKQYLEKEKKLREAAPPSNLHNDEHHHDEHLHRAPHGMEGHVHQPYLRAPEDEEEYGVMPKFHTNKQQVRSFRWLNKAKMKKSTT